MFMNVANQSNLDAARVGFHAAFLEQLGLVDAFPLEKIYLEVPSTTSIEEWDWLGDLPGLEEWTGDRIMSTLAAYKLRVANRDWASGIRLHQNNIKDDRLGLFPTNIAMLAQAAKSHRVEMAAEMLLNGFDGVQFPKYGNGLAYDGAFFFSTTRATGSNKLTTALDSTAAGLDAAELLLESQTNYSGTRKLRIQGTDLIVGPKLAPIAQRLMSQDFITNAAGTATQSNPWKGRYNVIVEPWISGAYQNYWFLADLSKPVKPMLFQLREDISTSAVRGNQGGDNDSVPRFKNGEIWFGAEARYNEAYFEPRLIVGSQV